MMKSIITAAAISFAAVSASAATLTISGGAAGSIPSTGQTNEVLDALLTSPQGGSFGSTITVSDFFGGGTVEVLVEVFGWEAGFDNTFATAEDSFTSDAPGGADILTVAPDLDSPLAAWVTDATSALAFTFSTTGSVLDDTVSNGDANANTEGHANFFAFELDGFIWLAFDDGGGSDDDDNHDDLVVRLSIIPLPAGAVLLLSGLGILGLRRRFA